MNSDKPQAPTAPRTQGIVTEAGELVFVPLGPPPIPKPQAASKMTDAMRKMKRARIMAEQRRRAKIRAGNVKAEAQS